MSPIPQAVLSALRPRRSLPATISPPPKKPIETLRKKLQTGKFTYRHAVARGVDSQVAPELAELRRAAHVLIEDLTLDGLRAASLEALAGFWLMVRTLDHDLPIAPALLDARGVLDLVEIATLADDFSMDSPGNWTVEAHLLRQRRHPRAARDWMPVRNAVCAASEADYVATRERALTLGSAAPVLTRAHLAYVFPDEAWGDAALTAWFAENEDLAFRDGAFLLSVCREPELIRRFAGKQPTALSENASDLALTLSEADAIALLTEVLPALLIKPQYGPLLKTPPRDVATALTYFRTSAGATALAPYAGHPILGPIVAVYFQDNPEWADALSANASKAGRAAAARVLAQIERSEDDSPLAAAEDIPALLRERPWRKALPKGRVLGEIEILPGLEEHLLLPPEARRSRRLGDSAREMTQAEEDAYRAKTQSSPHLSIDYEHARIPHGFEELRVPDALGVELWNQGRGWTNAGPLAWVARQGLAALPGFLDKRRMSYLDYEGADEFRAAIFSFISPRIALLVARIAARRKKHRREALRWLSEHATTAALGLVPAAVGPLGADRDDAEAALGFLAKCGQRAAVEAASARYGAGAAQVIADLLARDPLGARQTPSKLPEFLRVERLPALRLTSGERLPEAATLAVLEMLSISSLDAAYPGLSHLTDVRPESLEALACALLEQWLLADAPGRCEWMLHAVVQLRSEEGERRIASLAREWARRDKAKAERACAALAALATDAAFMHLGHIAETSRFEDLRKSVQGLLDDAASARGLSREELEDRTVPNLGLDADGCLRISFGERQFTASLDASLALVVRDADGSVLGALPRKTKQDDEGLAKAGIERLKTLRADAATIAVRQVRRLERMMVNQRAVTLGDFRLRVASHPVTRPIARALVWCARLSPDEAYTFRIAEDGTFANVEDTALTLNELASVTVAHPLELGAELVTWSALFADYEIIQPFAQLARETFVCPAEERTLATTRRFAGLVLEATKLLGSLEARDFVRSHPGSVSSYLRALPGSDATAELAISPGFEIADLSSGSQAQTLGVLQLSNEMTFGALPPIVYSELMRDLELLRRST